MSLYPCPGTSAVTSHFGALCGIDDASKNFPSSARVVFGSVSSEEQHAPVVLFFFGRGGTAGEGAWKDDVPRLQLTLDPTSVRELRVDTDGVMHVDALVGSTSDTEFSPLAIRLLDGAESNPTPEQWIEAAKATALDFMSFWQEEAADAAAAESEKLRGRAGARKLVVAAASPAPPAAVAASSDEPGSEPTATNAPAEASEPSSVPVKRGELLDGGADSDAEDEEDGAGETPLPGAELLLGVDGLLTKRDGMAASSGASVAGTSLSAGLRSTSSRMLKMKEVQEAALGLSRILSNVNINKEARNGLSRRQFRRRLLQEQLSALADSVGGTPGSPSVAPVSDDSGAPSPTDAAGQGMQQGPAGGLMMKTMPPMPRAPHGSRHAAYGSSRYAYSYTQQQHGHGMPSHPQQMQQPQQAYGGGYQRRAAGPAFTGGGFEQQQQPQGFYMQQQAGGYGLQQPQAHMPYVVGGGQQYGYAPQQAQQQGYGFQPNMYMPQQPQGVAGIGGDDAGSGWPRGGPSRK